VVVSGSSIQSDGSVALWEIGGFRENSVRFRGEIGQNRFEIG
jgi:hypothetical protein